MKKALSLVLVLFLLVSVFAGCSKKKDESGDNAGTQTETPAYEYMFRDLPEAKYITPAESFAGGDGTKEDPYQISDANELALLHEKIISDAQELKSDYSSAYYVLTADIAINDTSDFENWSNNAPEYSWLPIGFGSIYSFDGVLDGDGHTISGIYINANSGTKDKESTDNYGLFDTLNGTVENLNIDKSYFAVSGRSCGVGSIAGLLTDKAEIDSCTVNAVIDSYDSTCGGIAGKAYGGVDTGMVEEGAEREIRYSVISYCTFDGVITQVKDGAAVHIGGIIGSCDGKIKFCENNGTIRFAADNVDSVGGIAGIMSEGEISDCENNGKITCEYKDGEYLAVAGGIVGKVFVSATGSETYMSRGAEIENCKNFGEVSAQMYAGGIAGQVSNDNNDYCVTVSYCENEGVVESKKYTGGIIGYVNCLGDNHNGNSIVIEMCDNKADLSKGTVGGIVAQLMTEKGDMLIKDCTNSGNLSSEGQHCAGIIAYWIMNSKPSDCNIVIENCNNTGNIVSSLNAGGIVSFMDMPVCTEMGDNVSVDISYCENDGDITSSSVNAYIGGILGNWGMKNITTSIDNCNNSGTLSVTAEASGMTEDEAEIMTVSRIVGGIVGRVGSGLLLTTDSDNADNKNVQAGDAVLTISNCTNEGGKNIVNENAENYKNWFGGIIGNTCAEDGFSVLVVDCTYKGFDRGLENDNLTDVGTKN